MTEDEYTGELDTLSFKLPKTEAQAIHDLAEKHDTTKSAVLRELVDNGLRAHKYYDEFEIQP